MFEFEEQEEKAKEPEIVVDFEPESVEETSRRTSIAVSLGVVFFLSVAFMLFLGWIADWLLGSSPWGIVGGIVIGSILGFVQFFRSTSQIFNTKKSEAAMRPLMPPDDDDR
jgi:F0F1-type ATP synthase assembly protein I